MKRTFICFMILFSLLLSGCGSSFSPVETATLSIEQGTEKHSVFITDKSTGQRYGFKVVRVKKSDKRNASKTFESDNLIIKTEGRQISVKDKKNGIFYVVNP